MEFRILGPVEVRDGDRLVPLGSGALLADAGFEPVAPEQPLQMAAFRLPSCDPEAVQRRLFEDFRIEVPVRAWNGRHLVRVSVAPYNAPSDLERLADALVQVLPPSA